MSLFLKRLEIQGFKSFANKTVLEIPKKIVAMVGPNGCGKSNIVDAFCFVLGEREASYLRQESLSGLIFAGSKTKPALSLAYVSFTLDNSSNILPLHSSEIRIKRKVDRTGNSEIFINNRPILTKDLKVLLAKTRISSRGLIIIRQGEVDKFIKKSFAERKALLEDFIGLREFILKKEQAQRQLISTKVNLEKVELTINELSPRLNLLKRQVSRYEKRREYEQKLTELENQFFCFKLKEIRKQDQGEERIDLQNIEKEIDNKKKELEVFILRRKEMEERLFSSDKSGEIREKLNELFKQKAQIEKHLGWLEAKLEQKESNFLDANSLLREIKPKLEKCLQFNDLELIKREIRNILDRINGRTSLSNEFYKQRKEQQKEKEEVVNNIKEIEDKISNYQKQEKELFEQNVCLNAEFKKTLSRIEEIQSHIRSLEDRRNKGIIEREKTKVKMDELEGELKESNKSLKDIEDVKLSQDFNPDEVRRRIIRLKNLLFNIGEIDQSLLREKEEVEKRYEHLNKQFSDLQRACSNLQNLISDLHNKINREFKEKIDLINKEFDKYFKILFKGGKARLKLEEAEDKQGIKIYLSLPSKKNISLEMLSGGERTLVSLALLFGLISISPPPFLILDEVDAALDEKNALKFAQLLKSLSKETQFIVITHNRATMEIADVLYGVTMGNDGISKVYSLKLES